MSDRGPRKEREVDPIKTLMAWAHWKKLEKPPAFEDDLLMAEAVGTLYSQVGTYKARYEKAEAEIASLKAQLAEYRSWGCDTCGKRWPSYASWFNHNCSALSENARGLK